MKQENNIYAGTFDEFRKFLIDRIYEDCKKKCSEFCGYNIGFCHSEDFSETKDVQKLYDDVSGWYGVAHLDSMFEPTSSRQFYSDYYGGGDFGSCDIFLDDLDRDYVAREVEKMITMTFGYGHSHDTCVWEEAK